MCMKERYCPVDTLADTSLEAARIMEKITCPLPPPKCGLCMVLDLLSVRDRSGGPSLVPGDHGVLLENQLIEDDMKGTCGFLGHHQRGQRRCRPPPIGPRSLSETFATLFLLKQKYFLSLVFHTIYISLLHLPSPEKKTHARKENQLRCRSMKNKNTLTSVLRAPRPPSTPLPPAEVL